MNAASSRSHCVIFLLVCDWDDPSRCRSKIGFVDLAGSERQRKTMTAGKHLVEGGAINRSLSALEKVVNDLHAQRKHGARGDGGAGGGGGGGGHVNFRDVKLTRLLQPFLMAQGYCLFILCFSQDKINVPETLHTLRFGQRLQGVSRSVRLCPERPRTPELGGGEGADLPRTREPMTLQQRAAFIAQEFVWNLVTILICSWVCEWGARGTGA